MLNNRLNHPGSDPEGYFNFYDYLINMHAQYLRTPLVSFKTAHSRNQALTDYELTVTFVNPYSDPKKSLKSALDLLAEIAESDPNKPDIWRGDTDVRLAKLNILAYQHSFFNEIPLQLQNNVIKLISEKFPSILKHPAGQRCSSIDPLLERMWNPEFKI